MLLGDHDQVMPLAGQVRDLTADPEPGDPDRPTV
jgi:hypothetical protein